MNCLRSPLIARKLRWAADDPYGELACILADVENIHRRRVSSTSEPSATHSSSSSTTCTSTTKFDTIIAADCLFFKEFHSDLIWILRNAIEPNGKIFLLQPRRGNTTDLFLSLAESWFDIVVSERYCSKVILQLLCSFSNIYLVSYIYYVILSYDGVSFIHMFII